MACLSDLPAYLRALAPASTSPAHAARLEAWAGEVDRAFEALRPFARAAEFLTPVVPGADRLTDDGIALTVQREGVDRVVTFGDLRRAALAVSGKGQKR